MDALDATLVQARGAGKYLRMPKGCTAQTGELHSATYMY